MNFELIGKLALKEDVQAVTASFRKREFVIEVENERNPEWNDFVKFQLTQDRCELLDNYADSAIIKVHFNIKGRKWEKEGKISYFNSLEAWRIEAVDTQAPAGGNTPISAPPYKEQAVSGGGVDDLPF